MVIEKLLNAHVVHTCGFHKKCYGFTIKSPTSFRYVCPMKSLRSMVFPLILSLIGTMACTIGDGIASSPSGEGGNGSSSTDTVGSKLRIRVGSGTFTATLANNATAIAFKATLPITINMTELNGNEKYVDLPNSLPANASKPVTIQNGELMLYGSNTLVLFYKTFSTSYSYTPIARIENPAGLATALGSGKPSVTFEAD